MAWMPGSWNRWRAPVGAGVVVVIMMMHHDDDDDDNNDDDADALTSTTVEGRSKP
jgi:hypothetical protein